MLKIRWIAREDYLPDKRHGDETGCVLAWHRYQGMMVTGIRRVRECEFFTHWAPAIEGPYQAERAGNGAGIRPYDIRGGGYAQGTQGEEDAVISDAKRWSMPMSPGHRDMLLKMKDEYGEEWVKAAIARAATGNPLPTWGYVEGILKAWKRKGGMDERGSGKRQGYGKQVGAQQYEQRQYTEEELLAVSDDLIQEAMEARKA